MENNSTKLLSTMIANTLLVTILLALIYALVFVTQKFTELVGLT